MIDEIVELERLKTEKEGFGLEGFKIVPIIPLITHNND